MTGQSPRLLDQVRDRIRLKHYSIRTEDVYTDWVRRYVLYHGKRHPRDLGAAAVEAFLTHLAVVGNVAASTQNQAKSALLFLYREVLGIELPWLDNVQQAKQSRRLPVVLTVDEVRAVLERTSGTSALILRLLYGTGMRVMEGARLRLKDVEFSRLEILIRDGKGGKDRVTMLPASLREPLREHLIRVKALHDKDLLAGFGAVHLPYALERKYPNAPREWGWQYVFPSARLSTDPRSGRVGRHHVDDKPLQRALRQAARAAGITKSVSPHTLRHYLPFLTMSSDSHEFRRFARRIRSRSRYTRPITRHNCAPRPTDCSGIRGAGRPACSALACRAAEMSSQEPSPSLQSLLRDRFAWFPPIHARATMQSPNGLRLLVEGPLPWCVSSGER